jgi:hypothetical protein
MEKDTTRFAIVAVAALGALLASAPGALAGTFTCSSTVTSVPSGDNVSVPTGATCTLNGATVNGNVIVGKDATLSVNGGSISGNVQGNYCNLVNLFGPDLTIVGNVVIQNCTSPSGTSAAVNGGPIMIGGSFTCNYNNAACTVFGATIGNNVAVTNNNATGQSLISNIGSNIINGNLLCQGNLPGVMNNGSVNAVAGHKVGQCAASGF